MDFIEKFISISGEPPIQGSPTLFYRFSGCNLNCPYCDTPYFNEVNFSLNEEELKSDIISELKEASFLKILFTGGEPLLGKNQDNILSIAKELRKYDFFVETNGTIKIKDFSLSNLHFVIDWKAPSSKSFVEFNIDNLHNARADKDILKFVIDKSDFDWLSQKINFIKDINPTLPIYIIPQWNKIELSEIADFILTNRYDVNLSFQLHKYIWQPGMRGV